MFLKILIAALLFTACNTKINKKEVSTRVLETQTELAYDFSVPIEMFLDDQLTEISGLGYDKEEDLIYAHNDEKGQIYQLNKTNGQIVNKFKFAKNGDYEAIEKVGDDIIVVTSNGDLFYYNLISKKTKKVKTSFTHKNNIEGLCFDAEKNILLLTCKGEWLEDGKSKKQKAIYAYDLKNKKVNPSPYLVVEIKKMIRKIKKENPLLTESQFKKAKHRIADFSPSGIAIDPATKNIYVISARGSSLVVFNPKHKIEKVVLLDEKVNPQPEGICFDSKSNLYISTEGKLEKGKIFKFLNTQNNNY